MHFVLLLLILKTIFTVFVKCQINTPPSIWLDSRNWIIRETEVVGSRINQVHADDAEGDSLIFGLEHTPFDFSGRNLPFRIDDETGTVYLNESLIGRVGENLHLYVTVSDGKYTSKNEANINIIAKNAKYLPSKTNNLPPQFSTNHHGGFLNNYPLRPSPIIPNNSNFPVINNPSFSPKFNKPTKLVKLELSTTTTTEKVINFIDNSTTTTEIIDDVLVKTPLDVSIVPILSFLVLFIFIVAICLYVFRKKIDLFRKKESTNNGKEKESVVNQEIDIQGGGLNLNLHEWRGPRAFGNRYESWQTENNRIQSDERVSEDEKMTDNWEYPRHRLKFFNILGEGAFGQVWKCEAQDLDCNNPVVAVKTLKENATEKEKSDLVSELNVMKMLKPHPNVVKLLGCCTDKEPIFLIMEFIEFGKLQSYLRSSRAERYYNNMHGKSKNLTSRDLTSFVYQIAKGMEFLSGNGIIHRDLAARNILINSDHICKVADFGFARDIITDHVYERKSEGRLPIRWMAPESLYDNIFTIKSDVWSFGVLMWEIVTLGSTPYPGMSAVEVMKKVRDGYRLDKPEHCRRELYNIMYYCWDQNPKERPSFTEILNILEKLLMTETDYIELERFPDHSYYNVMSLSGEKL